MTEEQRDGGLRSDPLQEIEAMKSVAESLKGLSGESIGRVLNWAADSFGVSMQQQNRASRLHSPPQLGPAGAPAPQPIPTDGSYGYTDIALFFSAASPSTGTDQALVVCYWKQVVDGLEEFGSRDISSELKDLGYNLSNITATLNQLISRTPSLIVQTRKLGKGRQAQKRFKVTSAGIQHVRKMIEASDDASVG